MFHRGLDDSAWGGADTTVVDPATEAVHRPGLVMFDGVSATLLGPLNDEAIEGAFHDDTFDCLARGHEVKTVDSAFQAAIHSLTDEIMEH